MGLGRVPLSGLGEQKGGPTQGTLHGSASGSRAGPERRIVSYSERSRRGHMLAPS